MFRRVLASLATLVVLAWLLVVIYFLDVDARRVNEYRPEATMLPMLAQSAGLAIAGLCVMVGLLRRDD